MKQILLMLLMLAAGIVRTAAQSGEIYGTILDEKKQPMIGAVVQAEQKGITKGGAQTDLNGNYSIKPLPAGTYELRISYAGYKQALIQHILVAPNAAVRVNNTMAVNENALKDVVVLSKTYYKNPLIDAGKTGPNSTITSRDIHNAPTRNLNDLAATSTGVYQSKSSSALNIGGSRTEGTLYIIDGVQVQGNGYLSRENRQENKYFNPSEESYKKTAENDFMTVKANPLSTMSVDVDRAAYSNIRRFINDGQRPPADAVRIEEMVNYFDYHYPQPEGQDPIAIVTETTECPWNPAHKLLHIGMQARKVDMEKLPPSNIVFLIDVSGSMNESNKLPLLQSAFKMLTDQLRAQDKVSIVVYAGNAGLVLPPTPGNRKQVIKDAIDRLQAGGSTAGGAGIKLAYATAQENFIKGGNNRVILATDGDFNVGVSGDNELEELVTKERDKGVFLTCLGFGMGNYKDSKMEVMADKGNGNYVYIDNMQEAQKTLVSEFGGTLFTVAKDVKSQIEFNPAVVQSYRLVGYENRLLNEEDFKDDKKDAGDMGSGHSVTILYEIVPAGAKDENNRSVDPLKYQQAQRTIAAAGDELATIKFRYKQPDGNKSKEMVHIIRNESAPIAESSDDTRFSAAVALFGMMLKDSRFKGRTATYESVLSLAGSSRGEDKEGYRSEFIRLVKSAQQLVSMK